VANLGFYDHNDRIFFPLIAYASLRAIGGADLPELGLMDAGFIMGIDTQFVAGNHVTLYSIVRALGDITLVFRSDAAGAAGWEIRFEFSVDTPPGVSIQNGANPIGNPTDIHNEMISGYIVVGDLSALIALSLDTYVLDTSIGIRAHVEDGLLQNLNKTYVRTINLANDARRCLAACCEDNSIPATATFIAATNIVGDVKIKPGYSAIVEETAALNLISIGAIIGAGQGAACVDVLIDEGGMRNDPDIHGVPQCESCDDLIRSINGVVFTNGKALLTGGPSTIIEADPDHHAIHVRFKSGSSSSSGG
jgi:hypothetical protein